MLPAPAGPPRSTHFEDAVEGEQTTMSDREAFGGQT
jgi:hypothetical protein